jgi:hypothetical protein
VLAWRGKLAETPSDTHDQPSLREYSLGVSTPRWMGEGRRGTNNTGNTVVAQVLSGSICQTTHLASEQQWLAQLRASRARASSRSPLHAPACGAHREMPAALQFDTPLGTQAAHDRQLRLTTRIDHQD